MFAWWGPILHEYYAGTETNALTYVGPDDWLAHPRTVGRAVTGTIRICDEDGTELPPGSLVDGVIILIASALLVTPGILTDVCGFLCLVPSFRSVLKEIAQRGVERMVEEQRIRISMHFEDMGSAGPRSPVYDMTPEPDEQLPTTPRRRD